MARIYREVEDIQEPTPRPSGDAAVKIAPGAPFDSQKRVERLEMRMEGVCKDMEGFKKEVKGLAQKFDERFSKKEMGEDEEEQDVVFDDEESTAPEDETGMKIGNVDSTTSAAPLMKPFEVSKQRYSKRRSIVGAPYKERSLNLKGAVKEFLRGCGGVM